MSNHARNAQSSLRDDTVLVIMSPIKVWIGHDRTPGHFIEGNVFCREIGRRGNDHSMAHPFGVKHGPRQDLHSAKTAAHHGQHVFDAQARDQSLLRLNPILNRDHGEIRSIGLLCLWIDLHGPC